MESEKNTTSGNGFMPMFSDKPTSEANKKTSKQGDEAMDENNAKFKGMIELIELDKLKDFQNHPFEPYEGKRFMSLVESIRYNDVHNPIIVRPIKDGDYEILSGHNRVRASREAEKKTIPAIILSDLTEEEALLVVTETNLYQRSTTDMNPSELALALTAHYNATKKQGKRTGFADTIEKIMTATNDPTTSGTVYQKLDTREQVGAIYGMSSRNVGHYVRINKLIKPLKVRLDKGDIAKRTAVSLSYLSDRDQSVVDKVLGDGNYSIAEKDAEALRVISKDGKLTQSKVKEVLAKEKSESSPYSTLKMRSEKFKEFFDIANQRPEDIENEILEALEFYRKNNPPKN